MQPHKNPAEKTYQKQALRLLSWPLFFRPENTSLKLACSKVNMTLAWGVTWTSSIKKQAKTNMMNF